MGNKTKIYFLLVSAIAVAFAFNNCSRVEFEQVSLEEPAIVAGSGEPTDPNAEPPIQNENPPKPPVGEVLKICSELINSGQLMTTQFQKIKFADTESDRQAKCEYLKNGNLKSDNDFVQVRYEQSQKVDLPQGAVVCTVELKTDARRFIYDDMFYFTFNDYIIATSLKTSLVNNSRMRPEVIEFGNERMPVNLYKYDWLNIGHSPFNNDAIEANPNAFNYCLGSDFGAGDCTWPLTQQEGNINFGWDPELLIHLGLKADSQNQRFGFIVTGDDDAGSDCYHPDMEFEVKTGYYIP